MNITPITTALRRFGQAMSVALVAAGFAAVAPVAHAQSGNLSLSNGTPSNCTSFSGFSWSGGTLVVNCSAPAVDCTTTATTGFHVAGSSMNATVNTIANVTIQRDGGCAGSYTVNFQSGGFPDPNQGNSQPTGWSVSPQSSVTFAQGEISKTIQVNVGSTAGLIGVWMANVDPNTVSATGGMAIYVQPQAPGPGSVAGCNTSANYLFQAQNNNQVIFGSNESASNPGLMPGQTVALSFTFNPPYSGGGAMQLSPVTNGAYGQPAVDTEISIATCPGVFQNNPPNSAISYPTGSVISQDNCDIRVPASGFAGQGVTAISASTTGASNSCKLTIGQTYYINIRHMPANFSSNTTSCTDSTHGCTLRVQPMGLTP